MKKILKIAIYSRKSKYSDKGDSVGNQIEIAKEYIQIHYPSDVYDIEITIYEDEGFSGGSFERPEFQKFLEDEEKNPFDILICYRLDRISRNIADFSNLINELTKKNTSFVSIKEQFDTKTPMGRAMMYIASVFAQLEREVIAERIRDNLLELSKTGCWLGGDAPLGYDAIRFNKVDVCEENMDTGVIERRKTASKLITNIKESDIIKLIFNKYLELKSLSKLETYLINSDCKTKKGSSFSVFALRWILTNPVYAPNDKAMLEYFEGKGIQVYCEKDDREKFDGKYGFLTYHKTSARKNIPMQEWIIAVGLHQPIIDSTQWLAVQSLIEKNNDKRFRTATGEQKQSIVSGLIRCKQCGSYMRPRNNSVKRADGTVPYSYYCVLKEKSKMQKCNCKNVSKGEELDAKIIDIIKETFVPNSKIYQELKKMTTTKNYIQYDNELELLETSHKKIMQDIDNLVEKIKYIDIDLMDIVNQNLRSLKEQKEKIEKEIQKQKRKDDFPGTHGEVKVAKDILNIIDNSFKIFEQFDLKTKRDIANLFIENIIGEGDTIEVNFLNTQIDESTKKLFIPTCVQVDNFSNKNLPTDNICKIAFKK